MSALITLLQGPGYMSIGYTSNGSTNSMSILKENFTFNYNSSTASFSIYDESKRALEFTLADLVSPIVASDDLLIAWLQSFMADASGTSTSAAMLYDAFGRQRVSEPYTLGDYKHLYGLDTNFLDVTANGGSVTFQPNKACARLSVTTASGSSAIHQTKFYHQYMPGKSQLIFSTFNLYNAVPNVTKRTGYFDAYNGIFFEQDGTGKLKFVIRTDVSGTPLDSESVSQTSWNVDPCDGSGPSGFQIQIDQTQIMFIEMQWLGVGRVRVGFVHDGNFVVAHEFFHDNQLPTVYMSNPNLPVRCEIVADGVTDGAYFDQICSTVLSEGGYVESGQDWSASNGSTVRSIAAGATVPLFAIRLTGTFNTYLNRMIVRLQQFSAFSTKEPLSFSVVKLPGIAQLTTASAWVDVSSGKSGVQYNTGATAYTDGEVISTGYVGASSSGKESITSNSNPSTAKKNYIVQNYASTDSEIYVIVATNIGTTTTTAGAAMQWREIY